MTGMQFSFLYDDVKIDSTSLASFSPQKRNVLGEKIRTLVNEVKQSGSYTVVWDGTDAGGNAVSSDVFYYQLVAEDYRSEFHRMILLSLL